jgi:hypothetical protein
MVVIYPGIISKVKVEHPEKHPLQRYVTEFGIISEDKDEHPEEHLSPRDVTELGIISDDKLNIQNNIHCKDISLNLE